MAKPLMLRIESELDERSATAAINKAQRVYSDAARDMGRDMSDKIGRGAREGGQAFDKLANDARAAYKRIGDANDELAQQERVLARMREEGTRGIEVQAERVKAARKRERLAIKEAAAAYDEYEAAANRAGDAVENSMKGAATGVLASGKEAASNFASGFAGSSALMRLGAAGGPIGLALAGVATIGVLAGKALAGGIADGMATLQMQDVFQARMGLDEASMAQFGSAAGAAYANNLGASVADNLSAAQAALQSGIIDSDATDAEIKTVIQQLQGMTMITEATTAEISRSIGTMMRTGMAGSVSEASDIIVAGFQNGLDVSGDWLDTINEYSTQFRKLGLEAPEVLTLLSQGMQGGARDTDKVADSLKEFSIRAVDGSKTTREGFQALGFDADEMGRRFAAGGETSKVALGAVLTALQGIEDPMQQGLIWTSLFGTQFEDMGDAINKFDMSHVGDEFTDLQGTAERSTKTATDNFKSEWEAAQRSVEQGFNDLKTALADWFTDLPLIRDLPGMVRQAADDIRGVPRQGAPGPIANAAPGAPMNPLDMLIPGSTPSPSGPGGLLMPSLAGPPPPGGPLPDAPVPGARTPILTDAQAEAAKEAEKAAKGGSSLPAAPSLPLQYTSTAGMPTAVANAQIRLDEVRHAQAEKEARLQQLLGSNVATADEIQKARNDVAKAEQDSHQAQQALVDAQQKTFDKANNQLEKQTSALESFGAQLDSDFGVSKGLAGIAENITKFVGNLLTAPLMNALGMVKQSSGFSGGQAGSGLLGMAGSSGAFGARFMPMPDGYGSGGTSYGGSYAPGYASGGGQPYGMPAGSNSGGYGGSGASFPDWVNQMAATFGLKPSTYGGHQESDRNEAGYAPNPQHENRGIDWTGPTENLQAFADYLKTIPGTLEQVIWQNPATGQSTEIAGGRPQPGYFSGDLAGHRDHVHTRQSASLPIPGGASSAAPGADWNAIAQAESSGNWQTNTGNGYSGGLQFAPSTWNQYGGQQYAPEAWQATPEQQIAVGERTLAGQGPGAWPNTFVPAGIGGGGLPGRGGGMPQGLMPGGVAPSQSVMGGRSFGQGQPASGGISFNGGIIGAAVSQAAGAAGGMGSMGMGGGAASAASDMAMQLIGRAVGAAGQYAGNAVGGLMETFSLNDSALGDPSASWFGRLAGAAAGIRPALPNSAGEMGGESNPNMAEGGKEQPPGPLSPQQAEAMKAADKVGGGDGKTINNNINVTNNRANEDQTGRVVQDHLNAGQAAVQPR